MSTQEQKTILLVEDEIINAMVTSKIIQSFGFNVITANSGEIATEIAISNENISLILMDINLGEGIDGTEAAQQILEKRILPIVFLTSHYEKEYVDRVKKITRYGYVIKNSGDFVLQSSIEMAFELFDAHLNIEKNLEVMSLSEERFMALFERAPLGYQSLDEEGNFIEVNQAWLDTLGYSREEVIGKWFGNFLAPEFTEAFRNRFPLFKAAGKIHSEFQMIHKSGEHRYIAFEGRIGYKPNGGFQQTHCIISDITESKRINEELKEANQLNEQIISSVKEGIIVYGPDLRYRVWNHFMEKHTGLKSSEVLGKHPLELFPFLKECGIIERLEMALAGEEEPSTIETPFQVSGTGRSGWGSDTNVPLRNLKGEIIGVIGTVHDISERKKAEEVLRKSEDKFRLISELSPAGLYITSPQGECSYVNPRWCEMSGLTPKEALGMGWINGIHPEDRQMLFDSWNKMVSSNGYWGKEYRFQNKEGKITWVYGLATPQKDIFGNIIGYVGLNNDITDSKFAEEKIKNLLAEKELLLKEVHHRIKNNMNTVAGIMSLQIDTLKEPTAIAALNDAKSRVASMMLLYDKLYRSDDLKELSFKEYILPLVDEIVSNFPNKSIVKIEKNIDDDIMMDTKKMSHIGLIINELLTNIMKYAFTNRDNGSINISAFKNDNHTTISVQDNGVGIPESIDIATSNGFGLQLVDMMAKQLQGTIKIERNNGTKFILEFNL